MKRLSFDLIIEKIWKQGISKWYKSKKFWMYMAPVSILSTAAITTATYFIVDKSKERPLLALSQVETPDDIIYHKPNPTVANPEVVFYSIDGKNFSSYSKAFEYFKKQLIKEENAYNLVRYKFEGEEYASQAKLHEAFKKRFAIKKVKTLKNPYKNIINIGNEISRNAITTPVENFRKIYNSTQLYRDAFGNVAYTRKDAVATYVTDNSAKVKYSYTGQDNDWHDSPTEAETQVKYGIKINKSLYYQYNGQFYNAFNREDNNALLEAFAPGYYTTSKDRMNDFPSDHKYEVFARQDNFSNAYAEKKAIFEKTIIKK